MALKEKDEATHQMDCKAVLETPAGTLRCMRLRTKFPHVYHSWHREMKSGAVMTIRWEA